jgi:hypothetical protein
VSHYWGSPQINPSEVFRPSATLLPGGQVWSAIDSMSLTVSFSFSALATWVDSYTVSFFGDSVTVWRVPSLTVSHLGLMWPVYVTVRSHVVSWLPVTAEAAAQGASKSSNAVLIGSVVGGVVVAILAAGVVFMVRSKPPDPSFGPESFPRVAQELALDEPTGGDMAGGDAPAYVAPRATLSTLMVDPGADELDKPIWV